MEFVIIGISILAFLIYIFFYRYFGIDARVQMLILHMLIVAVMAGLAVLLWISVSRDLGAFAVTAAIAALAAHATILLKYFLAEFGVNRRI